MSEEFMERMISSYDRVHNVRYWKEIEKILQKHGTERPVITDLGCGPGLLLRDLAVKTVPSKIYAIDLSDIMLKQAKLELEKIRQKLINNAKIESKEEIELNFIQRHLQDNPRIPSGIDYIFSSRVLRSFEDQQQIMTSIYNSLNRGGLFVLLDWNKTSINEYAQWFALPHNDFDNLDSWEIVNYHRNFSRYDLNDWKFILEAAEFKIIHQFQLDAVHVCNIAIKPQ